MKNVMIILLAVTMVFLVTACGDSSNNSGNTQSASSVQITSVTGDVVKADIPSSWCIVSGTEMNGASGSDYICHSSAYQLGDAYLQFSKDDRDIADVQALLEGEDPYGEYYGVSELANGSWYIAELAAAVVIDERVCLVKSYECDFKSDEVQDILASIKWSN